MKKKVLLFFCVLSSILFHSQNSENKFVINKNYDARLFLSKTQRVTFDKIFPEFDSRTIDSLNEWNDVDPLKIFTFEENRKRRRELFIYEINPEQIVKSEVSELQKSFEMLINNNIPNSIIKINSTDIKILIPYTISYETTKINQQLLEKLSDLGLQWSQVGGNNLYIYNGNILIGKYKSGYVVLTNTTIDQVLH